MESTEGRKDLVFITKVYEVNMMSWFSKEDLAFIMKVYEALSSTKFEAPTKTKTVNKVVDYLDDSDEKFEEWYRNLKASK